MGRFDLPEGGCLALTTHSGSKPGASAAGTVAFEVSDLTKLVKDLSAKGVTFSSANIESPVCNMAVCIDSEGNKIVLHQLKKR